MTIHPKWPDTNASNLRIRTLSYWGDVDTLIVQFTKEVRPSVSVPITKDEHDFLYVIADIHGITPAQFEQVRQQVKPTMPEPADAASMLDRLVNLAAA